MLHENMDEEMMNTLFSDYHISQLMPPIESLINSLCSIPPDDLYDKQLLKCIVIGQSNKYRKEEDKKKLVDHIIRILKTAAKDKPDRLLIIAVLEGDLQSVELLLKKSALKLFKKQDFLAVFYIIFFHVKSRNEMLLLFLQHGLDFSVQSHEGTNVLHVFIDTFGYEVTNDALKTVQILINSGVSMKQLDSRGNSLLKKSINRCNFLISEFFIQKGLDINAKSGNNGDSLLHAAAEGGCVITVNFLLKNGAEINAKNNCGQTPLHLACKRRNRKIIFLLISQKDVDICARDENGFTPFSLLNLQDLDNHGCTKAFIREFSKLSFENFPIPREDIDLIKTDLKAWEYFKQCIEELEQMSVTNFSFSLSYYSVLKRSVSIRKLAHLMKNEEFLANFETNLLKFTQFGDILEKIIVDAIRMKNESEIVYSRLKVIFGNTLPDLVLRKLTENFNVKDLPL